jgi:hypothetical protein
MNICIPHVRLGEAETPYTCRSLTDAHDAFTALGLIPLASFSVTSPSALPKVLRSLLGAVMTITPLRWAEDGATAVGQG